jgi:hypothetical protein
MKIGKFCNWTNLTDFYVLVLESEATVWLINIMTDKLYRKKLRHNAVIVAYRKYVMENQ